MKVYCLLLSLALSSAATAPPRIRLNSDFLPNQTEVVLNAGDAFTLSCHGNSSMEASASRLMSPKSLANPVEVKEAEPRHTGTYRCRYTDPSLEHLFTWIHMYVKDSADPSSVFVAPHATPSVREGQDFLFKCLLTDPSVTNFTLQSKGDRENRRGLPRGMNVTFDPRRGALIQNLQRSFSGQYACSGWRDGRRFESRPVSLHVLPRLPGPPHLSLSQSESLHLEGERFEVTCLTSNPSHSYNITWTPREKKVNVSVSHRYDGRLYMNSTLSVSSVSHAHTGAYTCTAINKAGVTKATMHLRVLDRPYLRIYLQQVQQANPNMKANELHGGLRSNVSNFPIRSPELNKDLVGNFSGYKRDVNGSSSTSVSRNSTVETYEGQDVKLTFVTEAYPPIREQHWTTPTHVNNNNNNSVVYQESFTASGYRSEASLLLRRVRSEDRGRYSFHFSNSFFNGSQNIDLRIYRAPRVEVHEKNGSLICSASGYPLPTILLVTCSGLQETCANVSSNLVPGAEVTTQKGEELSMHLPLPLFPANDVTTECVASNQEGESRRVFSSRERHLVFYRALIGSVSLAATLLLLLMVVLYKWRQKPRYEIRWKIIESTNGNTYTFIDPTLLPYNNQWEFPRDQLRLGPVLGSGAFGKVVEATAFGLGSDKVTRVAVKMLKPSAHSEERAALMSELKILSHLGYHDNILNLLGACTRGGPMLMITEYCSHGDLLNFLRTHTHSFMASMLSVEVEGGAYKNMSAKQTRLRSDSGISCCSEYQEMQLKHLSEHTDRLSITDLMRFAFQVSQGLDFLSNRNCIHRDVAARNVLLTDGRVAKICDFGLARDIRDDDSYIVQGNARLPVKWMAPESIFQCVYTVQSDVWSYGVLLWEIFSLGKSPYPNVAVDTNFYKMIKDGRHMDRPEFAPPEMYELMTLCWCLEPSDRPTFKMISQLIDRLLPSSQHSDQVAYRNTTLQEEKEEDREVGAVLKTGDEEERSHRDHHDNSEEEELLMKNIYQLS